NPTGIVGERPRAGDAVLTQAQKEREMQRLLDSRARYVIASRSWFGSPDPPEHMRAVLSQTFHPIRVYDSVVILERGMDEAARALTDVFLKVERGIADPRDADVLRAVIQARPEWSVPHELLSVIIVRRRHVEGALTALRTAYTLDPLAVTDLEDAANILLNNGRTMEA